MNLHERPRLISLEGNIGAGKSTFIDKLHKHFEYSNEIIFLKEPVGIWESVKQNGKNMLELYYSNPSKYSFAFQVMAYTTRLEMIRNTVKDVMENSPNVKTIVMERSLEADKQIFAKMLYDDGEIESSEFQIYSMMSRAGLSQYSMDGIIWLTTDADECLRRIKIRSRKGEETIPLDYLEKCEIYHKQWLSADLGFVFSVWDDELTKNPDKILEPDNDEIDHLGGKLDWEKLRIFLDIT